MLFEENKWSLKCIWPNQSIEVDDKNSVLQRGWREEKLEGELRQGRKDRVTGNEDTK